jgi:hypothetical protein
MNVAAMIEALIPLLGGIYATLLGYRLVRGPTTGDPKKLALLDQLKWLGPLVVAFGLWQFLQGFLHEPQVTTLEVVRAMRQRLTLPVAVDEATRLDRIDAEGQRIVYRLTITKPPPTDADRDALMGVMPQRVKSQICSDEHRRRLLRQNISLEFIYTIGGREYPRFRVTRADCGGA